MLWGEVPGIQAGPAALAGEPSEGSWGEMGSLSRGTLTPPLSQLPIATPLPTVCFLLHCLPSETRPPAASQLTLLSGLGGGLGLQFCCW